MDNQIELVSLDDLQAELQQLGLEIEDQDVLERMKTMCLLFNISCEKFVEAWYSFQLKSKIRGQPSLVHLDLFEKNVLTKDYVKEHELHLSDNCGDTRTIMASGDVVYEDGMIVTDIEPEVVGDRYDIKSQHELSEQKIEVEDIAVDSVEKTSLLPGTKQVSCYLGDSLEEQAWKRTDPCDVSISKYGQNDIDQNYKILDLRLQEFADVMDELILNFQDEMLDKYPEIGTFSDLANESAIPAYFCGRILKEIQGSRINSKTIILEGNSSVKKRIKLDVEALSDFSFFPGQLIAVKAVNGGDRGGLQVIELLDNNRILPPLPQTKLNFKKSMVVHVAVGPFGDESNVVKLIELFTQDKPHVIILLGPFIPANSTNVIDLENHLTSPSFTGQFIERILKVTSDSRIIAVPSPHDFFNVNVVPTTFSSPLSSNPRVHEMPNPCLVNVSGCIFGVSTTDVILDLLKEEHSKSTVSGERMKRLHEHVLLQQSFYPLFPPGNDVNIDYSLYEHLQMDVRPHVLIMPSDAKSFCRNIDGCICINPERVSKKSLARLKLECTSDEFSGSIENLISVEVFKFQ